MNFLKNSLREFKHVVWPTREETKKYFGIVLVVLTLFGIYLFLVGNIFSEALFGLKELVKPKNNVSQEVVLPEGTTIEAETLGGESISVESEDTGLADETVIGQETEAAEVTEGVINQEAVSE